MVSLLSLLIVALSLLLLGGRESPKLESWLSDPRLLETPHPKTYSLPVAKLLQNFKEVFTFVYFKVLPAHEVGTRLKLKLVAND